MHQLRLRQLRTYVGLVVHMDNEVRGKCRKKYITIKSISLLFATFMNASAHKDRKHLNG